MGGGIKKTIKRAGLAAATGGLSENLTKNPFGIPIKEILGGTSSDPSADFSGLIDPERDRNLILSSREQARKQLGDVLTQRNNAAFTDAIPQIAGDANASGVYTGTGYSEALARERSKLERDAQSTLAQQAVSDSDAALSRQFSLEDFMREAEMAKRIGDASKPKKQGKLSGALGGALSGAAAGSSLGPYGALAGGVLGGISSTGSDSLAGAGLLGAAGLYGLSKYRPSAGAGGGLSENSIVANVAGRPVRFGQTNVRRG